MIDDWLVAWDIRCPSDTAASSESSPDDLYELSQEYSSQAGTIIRVSPDPLHLEVYSFSDSGTLPYYPSTLP